MLGSKGESLLAGAGRSLAGTAKQSFATKKGAKTHLFAYFLGGKK